MNTNQIIEQTIAFVKKTLEGAEGGHDWFHIERVYNTTLELSKHENVDPLVVRLGALLHDIADSKFHNGDETVGPQLAKEFLTSIQVPIAEIMKVIDIIENISFKSSLKTNEPSEMRKKPSLELQVVQDADRLDAIGAIGIARAFNYGGFKNRALYDPDITPNLAMTKEAYKNSKAPTINHFYEKLLLLKRKMNTASGKKLAAQRHQFMLEYLEQFYAEWEGKL